MIAQALKRTLLRMPIQWTLTLWSEFPVNSQATLPELLISWGTFKHQNIDFAKYGELNPKAVEIANKVGWK